MPGKCVRCDGDHQAAVCPIKKWRVFAWVADGRTHEIMIEGTEEDAETALGDMLEGLGVVTAIEEIE